MKKQSKTLSLIVALCCMGVSVFASQGTSSVSNLFTIGNADATCCDTPINNGRCTFTDRCSPDAGGSNNVCDSTKGNCGIATF